MSFEIVTWPEIQFYMTYAGFEENCSLTQGKFFIEKYGYGSYFVNSEWKQKIDKGMNKEKIKEYLKRLEELSKSANIECSHISADNILCEILEELGYSDIVKAYDKIEKWFA